MFKEGECVVYKRDVCKIKGTKKVNSKDYYILVPIDNESLTINVPIENNKIKNIIDKSSALKLIEKIPNIEIIKNEDRMLEGEYKNLLNTGNIEDLVKIIKTTYLRNEARLSSKKKIGEKDDNYFKLAERRLYNELSCSLDMTYDDTKSFVIKTVNSIEGEI